MKHSDYLLELLYSTMAITGPGVAAYMPTIKKVLEGESVQFEDLPKLASMAFGSELGQINNDQDSVDDRISVIPIRGIVMKYGGWWNYGAEDYAELIRSEMNDDTVKAIILRIHSPGGSTSAAIPFKEVLTNKTKPVIALIDNMASSLGYWISVLADEVIAIDRMAQVGSIGVFARLIDDSDWLKKWGIKEIEIYPPESSWKNKPIKEALKNKPELLIQEDLTPMAVEFQNIIKANRLNLDMDVEGLLEGRVFYAYDALENGLIDSIMTFEETIKRAFTLSERQNINKFL